MQLRADVIACEAAQGLNSSLSSHQPGLFSYSHLQGMFFRTARMLEAGIKPVWVS